MTNKYYLIRVFFILTRLYYTSMKFKCIRNYVRSAIMTLKISVLNSLIASRNDQF